MLTKIEMQYMDAVIGIYKEMRKANDREIDWEQRRYELTKAAMQGMLSNKHYSEVCVAANKLAKEVEGTFDETEFYAKMSVAFADTVIKKLKESEK